MIAVPRSSKLTEKIKTKTMLVRKYEGLAAVAKSAAKKRKFNYDANRYKRQIKAIYKQATAGRSPVPIVEYCHVPVLCDHIGAKSGDSRSSKA